MTFGASVVSAPHVPHRTVICSCKSSLDRCAARSSSSTASPAAARRDLVHRPAIRALQRRRPRRKLQVRPAVLAGELTLRAAITCDEVPVRSSSFMISQSPRCWLAGIVPADVAMFGCTAGVGHARSRRYRRRSSDLDVSSARHARVHRIAASRFSTCTGRRRPVNAYGIRDRRRRKLQQPGLMLGSTRTMSRNSRRRNRVALRYASMDARDHQDASDPRS